ncbi:unnamed protein product, partial [Ceratitis capitata]
TVENQQNNKTTTTTKQQQQQTHYKLQFFANFTLFCYRLFVIAWFRGDFGFDLVMWNCVVTQRINIAQKLRNTPCAQHTYLLMAEYVDAPTTFGVLAAATTTITTTTTATAIEATAPYCI